MNHEISKYLLAEANPKDIPQEKLSEVAKFLFDGAGQIIEKSDFTDHIWNADEVVSTIIAVHQALNERELKPDKFAVVLGYSETFYAALEWPRVELYPNTLLIGFSGNSDENENFVSQLNNKDLPFLKPSQKVKIERLTLSDFMDPYDSVWTNKPTVVDISYLTKPTPITA